MRKAKLFLIQYRNYLFDELYKVDFVGSSSMTALKNIDFALYDYEAEKITEHEAIIKMALSYDEFLKGGKA